MKRIVFIVAITCLAVLGCRFGQTTDTKGTIKVTLSASTELAPNGCLLLSEGSAAIACKVVKAEDNPKEYTFTDLPVFRADSGYKTYTVSYFVDANGNRNFDPGNKSELASLVFLGGSTFADPYSTNLSLGPYSLVKFEGQLTFRQQVGSDSSKEYLVLVDTNNLARYYPLPADKSISLFQKKSEIGEWLNYDLYYLYDENNDTSMNFIDDKVVFLASLDGKYTNTLLDRKITKISGVIDYNSTDGRFSVATQNPPVVQIQDQSYWKNLYTKVDSNNTFTAFIPEENGIELRLYHVRNRVNGTNFKTAFASNLSFPVKLISGTGKEVAEDLNGTTGNSTIPVTYSILPVRAKAFNHENEYNQYNLGMIAGYTAISFLLYDSNDTVFDGALQSGGSYFTFYTLKNSAPTGSSEFSMTTFFDVNRDGVYNVGEPHSSTIKKTGDLNVSADTNSSNIYFHVEDANGTVEVFETFTRS